ncbi:MAG: hypothetical protein ACREIF_11040 [Chthoniobacterales bacterium]
MKTSDRPITFPSIRLPGILRRTLLCCAAVLISFVGHEAQSAENPNTVPTGVIVHSEFGGQIFGFDIDQAGNEGVLCEAQDIQGGKVLAAIETFDQTTGAIIKVIKRTQTHDDFITLGVVGNSVGLVEHEHPIALLNVVRTFVTLNPLSRNKITGQWTPPLDTGHLVSAVSRNQGATNVAVFAMDNTSNFKPTVFSSNVAANTFGPVITITDQDFTSGADPGLAYNSATNQAVLGHATLGNPFVPGKIAKVDLVAGTFTKFTGVGLGDVNGIAVDPVTNTACTTTEIDFSVEFYNLTTQTGFAQPLPNASNQFFSGADVEFDPVNRLFLVAQPNSSTALSGSSIHVYDVSGNLIESINGLNFSNAFNVVAAHIALNPGRRMGFVDGPDQGVTELQSFSY